jgi:aryl-alcohol dehydrogenase-like predicted oxidoreductase
MPRFTEPHFSANARLLPALRALAGEAGCTPAQLALAWLLYKAPHVVPIPGTTSIAHLEQNLGAGSVRPDAALMVRLEALINGATVSGARYNAATQSEIDTEELQPGSRPIN